MKNTIKFLGIIALVAVIGFSIAACSNDPSYTLAPTSVVLAYGSHGEPSNVEIYDLMPGFSYVFTRGNNNNSWSALNASGEFVGGGTGTVWSLAQAIGQATDLGAGVTTVQSSLLNGQTYNIFRVFEAAGAVFNAAAAPGTNVLGPNWEFDNRNDTTPVGAGVLDFDWKDGRNAVVDLRLLLATHGIALRPRMSDDVTPVFQSGVGDGRTTIIFLIGDTIPGEAGTVVFDNVVLGAQEVLQGPTTAAPTGRWRFATTSAGGATLTAVAGDNFFTLSNVGDTRANLVRFAP
ncbi:MAG: hypothetical protein FWD87_02820 [Spirochaetaceae bacterium]|nr:hypothetical protein [Spirochaetaceae bacterium]